MSIERFEYNLDYYSGAQASVYFDDIMIDEVTTMQWTVQQSKVPIYGYASQTFDEMAKGTIIVQGSFSINFVEAGYLWSVLNRNHKTRRAIQFDGGTIGYPTIMDQTEVQRRNQQAVNRYIEANMNPRDEPTVSSDAAMIEAYNTLRNRPDGLHEYSKLINDHVWGSEVSRTVGGIPEDFSGQRRTDRKELNGFDIYVGFQHTNSDVHTITKIEDVHLVGKAQTIVIDENPIQEVYSFYAKNVI